MIEKTKASEVDNGLKIIGVKGREE